jgi:hypothetical protein
MDSPAALTWDRGRERQTRYNPQISLIQMAIVKWFFMHGLWSMETSQQLFAQICEAELLIELSDGELGIFYSFVSVTLPRSSLTAGWMEICRNHLFK